MNDNIKARLTRMVQNDIEELCHSAENRGLFMLRDELRNLLRKLETAIKGA